MTLSLASTDNLLDAERRAALRRMRSVAVGLLVFAAAVYWLTLHEDGFLGFVNAGAEASMIGAIADWFAVVALFKHPLGLPVPHTALVQKRKEMFGRGLEEFVTENFLHEGVVSKRVRDAEPARKVGDWLAHEDNARRVVLEVADVLRTGLARIRDEDVADFMNQVVVPRFMEEPISPIAGRLLQEIVEDRAHTRLVDLLLEEAGDWLEANEGTFHDVVVERAPWWAPDAVNERVIRRLHVELVRWIDEIRGDPLHRSRTALDRLLRQFADDLLHDESTIARMEAFKQRMLEHPQVTTTYISLWNALRAALVGSLADQDGELLGRGVRELQALGQRLCRDADLRSRIDERVASLAVFFVERYGSELTSVITHTIDEWDGEQAARKIELHVGKDLQFIRINGTIVGGLVGVLIHAMTLAVS
jgi:uncharacterized membrane-anchored protein YjiN (DUF445 family)